jgi:lysophospholipase L1-like esterase
MKVHHIFLFLLFIFIAQPTFADFAVHDGDTVVFLGDSITAEGTYAKVIENYTLLRYPDRKATFINAGHGGETAAGGLARLQTAVFDRGATLLTVAYGINDIGWGGKADAEHRQTYLDSIRAIVAACKEHHVRVFICSCAATASDPNKSEGDFLQKMCNDGMQISRDSGEGAIDILGTMRGIQKKIWAANAKEPDEKKHETLHVGDGIHLNDLGETAMAYAILKGLGAPADVSSAEIDAAASSGTGVGCAISNVKSLAGGVEFDRLDQGLPLNFGPLGVLKFIYIPIPEEMNRYMLTVKNLPAGKYDLTVSGRLVGHWSAEEFAKGLNISSATTDGWVPGGPWDAQAALLIHLTNARRELMQLNDASPTDLKENPNHEQIDHGTRDLNDRIVQQQRAVAQPVPYHFVISPAQGT